MPRCDLRAEDCVADHLGLALDVRPGSNGQWSARCPAHDDTKRSMSLAIGTKGQRIIWQCHAKCEPGAVRAAMLARGISPGCIPWKPPRPETETPAASVEILAQIDKLLSDQPNPVVFMIKVTELLRGVDDRTAAQIAGISQATFYRHRPNLKDS